MPLSVLGVPGALPSAFGAGRPGDRVVPGRGSWMPSPDHSGQHGGPFPLPPDPSDLPPLGLPPGQRDDLKKPGEGLRDKIKKIRDKLKEALPGKSETGGPAGRFATRDWRALDRGRASRVRASSKQNQWALFSRGRPNLGRSRAIEPSSVNTLITSALRRPLVSSTTTEGIILKNGVKLGGLRRELWAKLHAAQASLAVKGMGIRVTSGFDGTHRKGSLHNLGRAVDVTPQTKALGYDLQVRSALIQALEFQGLRVLDEYLKPSNLSTGGHLHVELV